MLFGLRGLKQKWCDTPKKTNRKFIVKCLRQQDNCLEDNFSYINDFSGKIGETVFFLKGREDLLISIICLTVGAGGVTLDHLSLPCLNIRKLTM